jgi:hypothetical protein
LVVAPAYLLTSIRPGGGGQVDYAATGWGELERNRLNLPVTSMQPTSGRCPSLPLRFHKEKGDETLIFVAFFVASQSLSSLRNP